MASYNLTANNTTVIRFPLVIGLYLELVKQMLVLLLLSPVATLACLGRRGLPWISSSLQTLGELGSRRKDRRREK